MRTRVTLLLLALPAVLLAHSFDSRPALDQDRQPELPRFRAGANLVRVDAYISKDGVALTDLTQDDFIVYEDDRAQKVESFELIAARAPNPQSERRDPANVRDMTQQAQDAARVFTLFFDRWHVQLSGSFNARKPIIETLDKVIGPDDLVGLMTPEMSPSAITYSTRTGSIERMVTDSWNWGARFTLESTPQEDGIKACYPQKEDADLAAKMIARLREEQTLHALDGLVSHLEGLRPERKFVMIFTEGWPLYRADPSLERVTVDGRVPSPDALRTDPRTGGLAKQGDDDPRNSTGMTLEQCDRLRTMLAYSDHEVEFRQLLQRANRANVSFYPIDARGLVAFDTPIDAPLPPKRDADVLRARYDYLRDMASQTDGQVVLSTNDVSSAMQKVFADVGSYYLLGYYSTNTKLDGRFRRIRVEVKRDSVDVRARPGYLAPTESEARAAGVAINRPGAKPSPPATVTRALDALAPARGFLPMRVQAVGARNSIRAVVELDPSTARQPEWMSGGTLRVTFEPERAISLRSSQAPAGQTVTLAVEAGQRSVTVQGSDQPLPPGRYSVRAELTSRNSRTPLQVTTFATVPAETAEVGTGLLAARRGPSTGLAYIGTADPRFRRTERLRVEVALASEGFTGTGRLLTREGQATPLNVAVTTRTDETTKQQLAVGDVTLAPLAEGEYVLEISLTKNGKTDVVSYGFRIIP
jgi:VWFA-related protein